MKTTDLLLIEKLVREAHLEGYKSGGYSVGEYEIAVQNHRLEPLQFGEAVPMKEREEADWLTSDIKRELDKVMEDLPNGSTHLPQGNNGSEQTGNTQPGLVKQAQHAA